MWAKARLLQIELYSKMGNSKRVWPPNTTITHRRREEESQNTDCHKTPGRQIKTATSSLFHVKMIAKLEGHKVLNNKQGLKTEPHKQWEQK